MIFKYKKLQVILLAVMSLLLICSCKVKSSSNLVELLQDGDIIFQTSKSSQSQAIQLATKSNYSHMGIIFKDNEKVYVYEAVQPVKLTPLKTWIARGEYEHYVVKRLKNADKLLTLQTKLAMKKIATEFLGKPYDLTFEWDDTRMYCSEIVWKIYQRGAGIEIGKLERLRNFDLSHPIIQQKIKERYGDKLPLDEMVISPQAMYDSHLLKVVTQNLII